MRSEMKNGKTGTILGQENLRIVCIERKYRVSNSKIGFIVTAKKELDENATKELLHEDMELKTFLTNYEITDVAPVSGRHDHVDLTGEKVPARKSSIANIMAKKDRTSTKNDIRVKNHSKPRFDVKYESMKRRGLFDTLDLQETFMVKDYKKALEKKGVIATNTAMPYDDLEWLEKQGKIIRIGKNKRGAVKFMIKRKEAEIVT